MGVAFGGGSSGGHGRGGFLSIGRDGNHLSVGLGLTFGNGHDRHGGLGGFGGHGGHHGLGHHIGTYSYGFYPYYGGRYFPAYSYYGSYYPYGSSYLYQPYYSYGYGDPYYGAGYTSYSSNYYGPVVYGDSVSEYEAPAADPTYPTTPEPGVEAQPSGLLSQGDAAFAAGRFDEAQRYYVSAMLADDSDGVAMMLYSVSNLATGDYEVAAAALRRSLERSPDLISNPIDVRKLYGEAYLFDTHRDDLAAFVEGRPGDRDTKLLYGYVLFASGDAERAGVIFRQLRDSDSSDGLAAKLADAAAGVLSGNRSSR